MRYRFMRFPQGRFKAFTMSYDDGVTQDKRFIETADKYGIKCTLNINSAWLGQKNRLSAEELENLVYPGGHEIAVHGAHHIAPGKATPTDIMCDVLDCRRDLERAFGRIIRGMAYPDSGITYIGKQTTYEDICTVLKTAGIVYSRTLGGDNDSFEMPTDWYSWMPTAHHANPKLDEYLNKFLQSDLEKIYYNNRKPLLFYLWGHSYEFDNNNNWNLLEKICQTVGGREDIWYATNIEIYDYTAAYYSLVFNLDNTLVYNPSLMTVWFDADGKLYSVEPGSTLKLS